MPVNDRRIILLAMLLSVLCLAYFYAVNNLLFSSAHLAYIFSFLLQVYDSQTAWLSAGVCLLSIWWRNPIVIVRLVDFLGAHAAWVSVAVVGAAGLGSVMIYEGQAFSMDEYAAVFQAKIFALGELCAQLPPSVVDWLVPPGFNGVFLIASRETGRAIEAYWPGFSLLLAPFDLVRVPWLCNAMLTGASTYLIYSITAAITSDRRAAGWAMLFAMASGVFLADGISYYSMQAHMTANLLFAWLLMKPTPGRTFAAGLTGSLALVLHNPFPHTLFAIPWIWALARSKEHRHCFTFLLLGYLPLSVIIGCGWLLLRSSVTAGQSGFNVVSDGANSVFSIPNMDMVNMRVAATVKMWIWAVPGLFVFAVLGRMRHGANPHIRLLTESAVLTYVAYLFVIFDQGHGWGYRYFHSAWGVVPILAGCAMTGRSDTQSRLMAFAGAAALLNLLVVVPFQMMQINHIVMGHARQLMPPLRPGRNVYFIGNGGFYALDLVQIDPALRSKDLILASRGAALDAELRRQNWPEAARVGYAPWFQQWHLTKAQPGSNATGDEPFSPHFSPPPN